MKSSRTLVPLVLALSALWTTPAFGFCRTTTCGPGQCTPNPSCDFCLEGGKPLYWGGRCISFGIQRDASPLRGIDFETTRNIVGGAFAKWMGVDCGGVGPSLQLSDFGAISCDRQEYNQTAGNANVWMFRDDYWPYSGANATLALTTITFNVKTGEIFDADVEINSIQSPLTLGDANIQADLDSIVTHEAGHFLGLSHSCEKDATMEAQYKLGEAGLRTLEPDDVAGVCTLFPPGSGQSCDPTPRHGFSTDCCNPRSECEGRTEPEGCCTTAPGSTNSPGRLGGSLLLSGLLLFAARRRRRQRRLRPPRAMG